MELTERQFQALTRAASELEDYRRMVQRMTGYAQATRNEMFEGSSNNQRMAGRLEAIEYMNRALLDVIRERMADEY